MQRADGFAVVGRLPKSADFSLGRLRRAGRISQSNRSTSFARGKLREPQERFRFAAILPTLRRVSAVLTQTTASDELGSLVEMLSCDCELQALLAVLAMSDANVAWAARAFGVGQPRAYRMLEAANEAGLLA